MRVAVFDLDGTLADTSADLIAAANAALSTGRWQGRLDPVVDAAVAFAGGRAMLRHVIDPEGTGGLEAEVDALFPVLLEQYANNLSTHTRLYAGVEDVLETLATTGWTLAVCTNKPTDLAVRLLEDLGIGAAFAALLGADSLPVRKPDPRHLTETVTQAGGDPGRSLLVGDTITDLRAARAARMPCILVGFGPGGAKARQLGADAVIQHFRDLPGAISELGIEARHGSDGT